METELAAIDHVSTIHHHCNRLVIKVRAIAVWRIPFSHITMRPSCIDMILMDRKVTYQLTIYNFSYSHTKLSWSYIQFPSFTHNFQLSFYSKILTHYTRYCASVFFSLCMHLAAVSYLLGDQDSGVGLQGTSNSSYHPNWKGLHIFQIQGPFE